MRTNAKLKILLINAFSIASLCITGSADASMIYSDRTSFEAALSSSITDDYSNSGYAFLQDNATLSAVIGETDYRTTGFPEWNIVSGDTYCAGCNGSFELSFTTTSLGTSAGVFGVGLDILHNSNVLPYDAFITFGDNLTHSFDLGTGSLFFGLTSDSLIQSIHFGIGDGSGTTKSGYFQIDNLTIGQARSTVPQPNSILMLGLGLIGLALTKKK